MTANELTQEIGYNPAALDITRKSVVFPKKHVHTDVGSATEATGVLKSLRKVPKSMLHQRIGIKIYCCML